MIRKKRNKLSGICHIGCAVLLAVACVSCDSRPAKVLSEKEMEDLLTDIELAGAFSSRDVAYSSDSMRLMLVNSVLAKHGVTREQLDSTMSWYGRNMDEYDKILDKVDKRLASMQKSSASSVEQLSGDNIWPYLTHFMISEEGSNDGISFSLNSSEVEKGGVVRWQMRFTPTPRLTAILGVEYEDGNKEYVQKLVTGNKKIELELQTDSALMVKRIFGNMSVTESRDLPLWVDSISLKALPLTKENYYRRLSGVYVFGRPRLKVVEKNDTSKEDDARMMPQEIRDGGEPQVMGDPAQAATRLLR